MIFLNCLTRKLKDYFSLVAGITLIVGLLLKIPNRGYPVEFKPLNPLMVVDLNKFEQNIKTLKLTSVNRGAIIRDLGLKDVPINSAQHFICFFRETYYKIQDTSRNDRDITNTEITRADFQEDFEMGILKQVKTSLGYNDADTARTLFPCLY